MKRYRCLHCRKSMSGLMLRTHLVTDHDVAAVELIEKRLDMAMHFERVIRARLSDGLSDKEAVTSAVRRWGR